MDKIENINLIKSDELKSNILKMYDDVVNILVRAGLGKGEEIVRKLLYDYVLGVGKPISICDGMVTTSHSSSGSFLDIEVLVDYRVTYGYEPYQALDKPINLRFVIHDRDLVSLGRDSKLKELGI